MVVQWIHLVSRGAGEVTQSQRGNEESNSLHFQTSKEGDVNGDVQ
jgi:hypothetical protein